MQLTKGFFLLILLSNFCFLSAKNNSSNDQITSAREVLKRLIGDRAKTVQIEIVKSADGKDAFEVEAHGGKLILRGNDAISVCYGFNEYLKNSCHSMATWGGRHFDIPAKWPEVEKTKVVSPYKYRYYLNVCTFGYTTPYWDWSRWEKELDWMALHGMNMPLASVASEVIAERVWLKLGLTKSEIRNFFTGPAYLPWHRMGNINHWDGPLTDSWQKDQLALQHKIINRMQELGMHPIAPAFAGFVPKEFQRIHPDVKINQLKWAGFKGENLAWVLSAESPYFEQIGKLFIQEWEKEFGKNELYLSDSFNEMDVPVPSPEKKYEVLANYGEAVYKSIMAGDPKAVWVTQGWTFGHKHDFWDPQSVKALFSKVPDEKVIILDLANEHPINVWKIPPIWESNKGFNGKQWVYSFVSNFGGKNPFIGKLAEYGSIPIDALNSPYNKSLVGFGFAPEGIETNEVVYELLSNMGWAHNKIEINNWIQSYCTARYGAYPEKMKKAWDGLLQSCYNASFVFPRFAWQITRPVKKTTVVSGPVFMQAVKDFLECSEELKQSELYRNDALELAALYLGLKADEYYLKSMEYAKNNDEAKMKESGEKAIEILLQTDKLLASHPLNRLDQWLSYTQKHGASEAEQKHYDADAKRLITSWGASLNDYAARVWSGVIRDYYVPRIQLFLNHKDKELQEFDEKWINTPGVSKVEPYKDPVAEARKLVGTMDN